MIKVFSNPNLYIKNTETKGRGVFSKKIIPAGMVFDIAPMMLFEAPMDDSPAEMVLKQYVFNTRSGKLALCLGFGSLYNHSLKARASCYYDENNNVMVFTALQTIPAHTEITINYNSEEAGTDRFPELNVD